MARLEQEPTVSEGRIGACEPHGVFQHPAYGTITMTTRTGGGGTLFGSDLGHNQRIAIKISTAKLHRDLHHDWIHSDKQLIELEMSHAQFAQFITSNGNGSGTPVTITWLKDVGSIPAIKNLQTKHETHRQEIHNSAREAADSMAKNVAKLGAMIESGKLGKKELRELWHTLKCQVDNLPSNMEFAVKSAEEALEKATSDAKIEVESYVQMTAQRLGLKSISDLAQLADKSVECNHLYSRSMNQEYPRKCLHCGQPEKE